MSVIYPAIIVLVIYPAINIYICVCNISERSLLAQLRIGVLSLKIESGRYNNVKVEDRICELYDLDIEDENHFVCSCLTYADIREELLPIPDYTEFNYWYDNLLVFWMKNHWKKLGQFISKAGMVRRHKFIIIRMEYIICICVCVYL